MVIGWPSAFVHSTGRQCFMDSSFCTDSSIVQVDSPFRFSDENVVSERCHRKPPDRQFGLNTFEEGGVVGVLTGGGTHQGLVGHF